MLHLRFSASLLSVFFIFTVGSIVSGEIHRSVWELEVLLMSLVITSGVLSKEELTVPVSPSDHKSETALPQVTGLSPSGGRVVGKLRL